jgi:hypothetical protein
VVINDRRLEMRPQVDRVWIQRFFAWPSNFHDFLINARLRSRRLRWRKVGKTRPGRTRQYSQGLTNDASSTNRGRRNYAEAKSQKRPRAAPLSLSIDQCPSAFGRFDENRYDLRRCGTPLTKFQRHQKSLAARPLSAELVEPVSPLAAPFWPRCRPFLR